jgi:hypothetical protein
VKPLGGIQIHSLRLRVSAIQMIFFAVRHYIAGWANAQSRGVC